MANPMPSVPAGTTPVSIPIDSSSSTVWERVSNWVSENKVVVYTIAGVAVVVTGAGVVYYLNSDPVSLRVFAGRRSALWLNVLERRNLGMG
jgi:mitochondrial import receptor subunit TOM70